MMNIFNKIPAWTLILSLCACASVGSPDGGPYDEVPPRIVNSHPQPYQTEFSGKKVNIDFDEFIKIENMAEKVVFSPPQTEQPTIKIIGKRVQIQFYDSLKENTTYTIDFADAIVDNNEGNPMGDYCFTFSTGKEIDTMQVSGYVLDASNLEPIKGMTVGVYSDLSDSVFTTKQFERVSRTDGSGHFTIKGLAKKPYRLFALQDMDQSGTYSQEGETWGVCSTIFTPSSEQRFRLDSIMFDTIRIDTVLTVQYTHFFPDDLVVLASKKESSQQYLSKFERTALNKISFYFAKQADTLPIIKGLNFDENNAFILEKNATLDTLHYWVKDSLLSYKDTLLISMQYLATDTTGNLVQTTDTLKLIPKKRRAQLLKEEAERKKEKEKRIEKELKRLDPVEDSAKIASLIYPPKEFLEVSFNTGAKMDLNKVLQVSFKEPVYGVDAAHFRIKELIDTLYYDMDFELEPDTLNPRLFRIYAEWQPKGKYKICIDSASISDLDRKLYNNRIEQSFGFEALETYGSLTINVKDPKPGYTVTLLKKDGSPVRNQVLDIKNNKGETTFFFLKAGTYWVRMWYDRNQNGKWDTGDWDLGLMPEEMWYLNHEFEVKANWDIETDDMWDVTNQPIYKQKSAKITKQKPDKEKTIKNRNWERAKEFQERYTIPPKD